MADSIKKLLTKITPQAVAQLDETLGDTFFETVALALIDELPSEDMGALGEVLRSGDSEALEKFLRARIPDMDRVIAEALIPAEAEMRIIQEEAPARKRVALSRESIPEDATPAELKKRLRDTADALS